MPHACTSYQSIELAEMNTFELFLYVEQHFQNSDVRLQLRVIECVTEMRLYL